MNISQSRLLSRVLVLLLTGTSVCSTAQACFTSIATKSVKAQERWLTSNKWMTKNKYVTLKFKNGKKLDLDNPNPPEKQDNADMDDSERNYFEGLDKTGCYYRIGAYPFEDYDGEGGTELHSVTTGKKYFIRGAAFSQSNDRSLFFTILISNDPAGSWFQIVKLDKGTFKVIVKQKINPKKEFAEIRSRWISNSKVRIDSYTLTDNAEGPKDEVILGKPAFAVKKNGKWQYIDEAIK